MFESDVRNAGGQGQDPNERAWDNARGGETTDELVFVATHARPEAQRTPEARAIVEAAQRTRVQCRSCAVFALATEVDASTGLCVVRCLVEAELENAHADGRHDADAVEACPSCRGFFDCGECGMLVVTADEECPSLTVPRGVGHRPKGGGA